MRVHVSSRVARRLLRFEVERLCARAGVTHAELGARLGISRPAFSQAAAGRNLLSKPTLEVLAAHLDAVDLLPWLIELWAIARPRPGRRTRLGLGTTSWRWGWKRWPTGSTCSTRSR